MNELAYDIRTSSVRKYITDIHWTTDCCNRFFKNKNEDDIKRSGSCIRWQEFGLISHTWNGKTPTSNRLYQLLMKKIKPGYKDCYTDFFSIFLLLFI